MIFGALLLTICLCTVAAQHSSAADGLAGRARRNLRSLQDASEETAAFEEDEVPFVDEFADLSMSMLMVDDGEPDDIILGTEITEQEFVRNYRYLVKMGDSICGASVISLRAILTAAHCFINGSNGLYDASNFDYIEVNRYDLSTDNGTGGKPVERRYFDRAFQDPETTVGKAQIHIHPCYDGRVEEANSGQEFIHYIENDFALVILKDPLPDYITPVKLNSDDSVPTPGVDLQTMGWGKTEEEIYPDRPSIVTLSATSNEVCEGFRNEGAFIPDNMVCAFDFSRYPNPHGSGCFGDSGGPLVYNNGIEDVQVGIVSWGPGTCQDAPSVFSRVSNGYDWIVSTACHNTNDEASFCKSSKSSKSAKKSAPSWESCSGDL